MSILHPKRIEDPAHRALIRSMPCVACELAKVQQTNPTQGHHIRERADGQQYGGSQKASDLEMVPLCHYHHWNNGESPYTHRGFLAEFGSERDLLALVLEKIKRGEAA
jgi:hypothetical protein